MPEIEDRWPSKGLEFNIVVYYFLFYCAFLSIYYECHVRTFTLLKNSVVSLEIKQQEL